MKSYKKCQMLMLVFAFFASTLMLPLRAPAESTSARCPDSPDDFEQGRELAGDLFSEGERLFEQGEFTAAVERFICSLQVQEHPNTLYNIAEVAKVTSDKKTVVELLEDYLDSNPDSELSEEIGFFVLDMRQLLDIGRDESPPVNEVGQESMPTQSFEHRDSDRETRIEKDDENDDRKKSVVVNTAGIALLGLGGAALLTGVILQAEAANARDRSSATNDMDKYDSLQSKSEKLQLGAIIGFVAAGAVATTGLVLLLVGKRSSEKDLDVSVVPGPTGVSFVGRF